MRCKKERGALYETEKTEKGKPNWPKAQKNKKKKEVRLSKVLTSTIRAISSLFLHLHNYFIPKISFCK